MAEFEGAVLLALVLPEVSLTPEVLGTTPVMLGIVTASLELEVSSEVGMDTGGIPVFVMDVTTCVDSVTEVDREDTAELNAEEIETGPPGIRMLLDAVLYNTRQWHLS